MEFHDRPGVKGVYLDGNAAYRRLTRSADNSEIATWRGSGVGRFSSDGGVSYRGAIYYSSQSPGFARLNGIACMFEYNVDASGKTESTLTEWK